MTAGADDGKVLIIGSVARPEDGWTVEDVFRNCASHLGTYVSMLPDGELGDRTLWITYLARHVYHGHPDIVTVSRHTYEDWKPNGYNDQWRVTVREGVKAVRFPKIGYADEAKASYGVFRALRDQGVIPRGVRFMVALPLTESATRAFVGNVRDFQILWRGYNEALAREIADLADTIPHEDLAIQWDLARETGAVEGLEFNFPDADLQELPAAPMDRYCRALEELCPSIPADVWLGLHVCYGSLGHKPGESPDSAHHVPLRDLNVGVDLLNRGVEAAGRAVQFVHMPVRFTDGLSDGFYRPLERLGVGGARVYLGVIDPIDGLEGARRRVDVARKYLRDFGLGTACGWGRRPLNERIEDLLTLERLVAEEVLPQEPAQA